jgi:hypothetical protein
MSFLGGSGIMPGADGDISDHNRFAVIIHEPPRNGNPSSSFRPGFMQEQGILADNSQITYEPGLSGIAFVCRTFE